MDYCEYHIFNFNKTQSYTASFDIYTTNPVTLQFLAVDGNGQLINYVGASCPQNKSSTVQVSLDNEKITDNAAEIKLRCITTGNNSICYVDNWIVKPS